MHHLNGALVVNVISPGFPGQFGMSDPSSITIPLPQRTHQLLFRANAFDIGDKDMVDTLDDDERAQEVTDFIITVYNKEVFYTSRSHITQDMPYEFCAAYITEQNANLTISLQQFGAHPGFTSISLYTSCKVKS